MRGTLALLTALAPVGCLDPREAGDATPVDLVVHGTVASVDTTVEGGLFMSRARVEVAATVAGPAAPAIEVELIGGVVNGIGQTVSGGLALVPGEEVVLFLSRSPTAWVAPQGSAAKYRVERPRPGVALAQRDLPGAEPVPLAVLLGAVSAESPSLPTAGARVLTPYVRTTTAFCGPEYPTVPLAWFTHQVPYVIDAAGSDDVPDDSDIAALRAAAQTWEDVPCSDLRLPFEGTVSGLSPGFVLDGENHNLMIWLDDWPFSPGYIALATVTFYCTTGEILDGDVVFNDPFITFSTTAEPGGAGLDVQAVATHELGHVLGFDHSPASESTMFATAIAGETKKRTLTRGDELGLCDVYVTGAGASGSDPRPDLPHTRGPEAGAVCGDGVCDRGEDSATCPQDCVFCGNGVCDGFEDCTFCPGDCGACFCGDGLCSAGECARCAEDCPEGCSCFDVCSEGPPQDPSCGECQAAVCAVDDFCCTVFWDAFCAGLAVSVCGAECDLCGNGSCELGEDQSCPDDCHVVVCGDGLCEAWENCQFCPDDCGACFCGDGACSAGECSTCAEDCPEGCFCSDVCSVGPPQDPSCGPCQADVCALEPFCCDVFWEPFCVDLAIYLCGVDCGGFCGDGECGSGEDPFICPSDCGTPPPPPPP